MKVLVTGATGNVGTSVLAALAAGSEVESITGVARRRPSVQLPKVRWECADVAGDDLRPLMEGADAVIHLAWLIQPSRDRELTRRVNVEGSRRVFEAAAEAGVETLIYNSSVGAYSKGPEDDRLVDESWPTEGVPSSFYSRDKASVESILDDFEPAHPGLRIVRFRPALIFKRHSATEIRRLFLGPFVPRFAFNGNLIPLVPRVPGLKIQAVHADDVAEAMRLALIDRDASGAFNLAADPVLETSDLAEAIGAREIPAPAPVLHALAGASWRLRLQPTPPGWVDMGMATPLMDAGRARDVLGWQPGKTGAETFAELAAGLRQGDGYPTPPLDPASSGPLRINEIRTGLGARGFV